MIETRSTSASWAAIGFVIVTNESNMTKKTLKNLDFIGVILRAKPGDL
jgi:hypothetical protein